MFFSQGWKTVKAVKFDIGMGLTFNWPWTALDILRVKTVVCWDYYVLHLCTAYFQNLHQVKHETEHKHEDMEKIKLFMQYSHNSTTLLKDDFSITLSLYQISLHTLCDKFTAMLIEVGLFPLHQQRNMWVIQSHRQNKTVHFHQS